MSTANKLSYLNDTKSLLRTSLNKFGSSILSTDTFRSYDTKLNEIYDKLPKVTQSGVGFTLTPVQNGQVDDFKMNGVDLEQETVETITVSDWEQGTIDTNGTLSNSTTEVRTSNFIKVYPNILYNISRTIYNSFMKFRFYDNNKNYLGNQADINVTTDNSSNRMEANVSSMKLTINDNDVSYIKLVDSSNDLSTIYTLTTNVTPSPIYPQEIKVVEGRQVITNSGKNLLKPHAMEGTNNGITVYYDEETQVYTFNGTCTQDNTTFVLSDKSINFIAGVTKSITYWVDGSCSGFCYIRHYDSSYASSCTYSILNISSANNKIKQTSNASFVCQTQRTSIRFNNGSVANNLQIKVMVTDDDNTDYEPYHDPVDYNIDLHGKNSLDISKNVNGYWYRNGVLTANADWSYINDFIEVKASTQYTISRDSFELNESQFSIEEFDANKKYIRQNVLWQNNTNKYTITTASNTKYVICNYRNGYAHTNLQFELGNVRTNYEEFYNYRLAKMPNTDYKNRIYKNNGNWYFERNVEKYIIDGTESWTTQSAYSGYYRYMFVLMENYKNDNLSYGVVGMNSHFIQRITQPHGDYEYLYLQAANNNLLSVYIQIKNLSTIANFKTWLSENNVVVWYVLANPVTTQITNTTLINQLEAISVHTGTNIITISNDNNMTPEIEITRLKELERLS